MTSASLASLIAYVADVYPNKEELSNARMTKIMYLADWFSLINSKKAISGISWYYDNYGPFVWDVKNAAEQSDLLKIVSTTTMFGNRKDVIKLVAGAHAPQIDASAQESLDHIISETKSLSWAAFIQLVYSTYPVAKSQKYTILDLPSLAKEYTASQRT